MITFECPKCSRGYKAPDEQAGKEVLCKECKHLITIPPPQAKSETRFDSDYDTSGMFMAKNRDLLQALLKHEQEAPPIDTLK